jgi:hypothetical protein
VLNELSSTGQEEMMMRNMARDIHRKPIANVKTRVVRTTLLDLVQTIQDCTTSDRETVMLIAHLINSGQVILSGTFAGARLVVVPNPEAAAAA